MSYSTLEPYLIVLMYFQDSLGCVKISVAYNIAENAVGNVLLFPFLHAEFSRLGEEYIQFWLGLGGGPNSDWGLGGCNKFWLGFRVMGTKIWRVPNQEPPPSLPVTSVHSIREGSNLHGRGAHFKAFKHLSSLLHLRFKELWVSKQCVAQRVREKRDSPDLCSKKCSPLN